jgi:SNF2 family DNA or RNA helicase
MLIEKNPRSDCAERIKELRGKLELTQQAFASRVGVSFTTVNRWENDQTIPSKLYWDKLRDIEIALLLKTSTPLVPIANPEKSTHPLDFSASPDAVKVLVEGERLSFGYQINPIFATEISCVDPLPHQRLAVYEHMLPQNRLRFLLADDAGAGKTIMTGLYLREMFLRCLMRRILIIAPAGLVGNWQREMRELFNFSFKIVVGNDAQSDNPFIGDSSNLLIISIDTLRSDRVFTRLQESGVAPYELVVFDEAHKLAADRGKDQRVRKTNRYYLAETLAGIRSHNSPFRLDWSAQHMLLLTATPHMGKEYPYYALWKLLEPDTFATPEAFAEYPQEQKAKYFIRRTKEEMVHFDGTPLYPKRDSNTLTYELTQGENSEQTLYDKTTDYLKYVYNQAKLLNREAARLAMSVFQRRLASSTYALLQSFERRLEKLDKLIDEIQEGIISTEQMLASQARLHAEAVDILDTTTADEEECYGDKGEAHEAAEDTFLGGVVATTLAELLNEKKHVQDLLHLARTVHDAGDESKFGKLYEILDALDFAGEKFIIFTEHRDTLKFLVKRLGGMGYADSIAQIHGGMDYHERDSEVERFRQDIETGGARFLICTDAAGEGINLQFCWIMINYDIPWNPARLEQRMGRIHRYGQKHDPVVIMNLVAPSTREGKVLKVLLNKLENIRKALRSDKVFDCIGRIFEGVSIKQYMELAVTEEPDEIAQRLDGKLTQEQVEAILAKEKTLLKTGGDVAGELPRLRESIDQESYKKLLPGYVRQYVQDAAPLLDIEITDTPDGYFSLNIKSFRTIAPLLPALEIYTEETRNRFAFVSPKSRKDAIWLHPGEPVFESFRQAIAEKLSHEAMRGAVFVDPLATEPYLFHVALLSIVRNADPEFPRLARTETLDCRFLGVRQTTDAEITLAPVEHMLLLKGGRGLPPVAQRLAVTAPEAKTLAHAFLLDRIARELVTQRKKQLTDSLPEKERFIRRGFEYRELELAQARTQHSIKARAGNTKVFEALETIKQQQRILSQELEKAIAMLYREPELIVPGEVRFIAHALVVPSDDPDDKERYNVNVERRAMEFAWAFEEDAGAKVVDVHTPDLAVAAKLPPNPGFDLWSHRLGGEERCIEVKGRANGGSIEITANEWAKACNLRSKYWLYVVYDCATPKPRIICVQDPFEKLLAKGKGSVLIYPVQIVEAGMEY